MAVKTIDVCGEICPYPLITAKKEMERLSKGDTLIVSLDYPLSAETIPRWAEQSGHKVLEVKKVSGSKWEIRIQKEG